MPCRGHIKQLAEKVKEGLDSVEGVEATLFQVGALCSPATIQAPRGGGVTVAAKGVCVGVWGSWAAHGTELPCLLVLLLSVLRPGPRPLPTCLGL